MAIVQGLIGSSIPAEQLAAQLEAKQQFLFFGHGAADQFLPSRQLRRLQSQCTCLLAGCSSGHLAARGYYSSAGPILAYVLAGTTLQFMACFASAVHSMHSCRSRSRV